MGRRPGGGRAAKGVLLSSGPLHLRAWPAVAADIQSSLAAPRALRAGTERVPTYALMDLRANTASWPWAAAVQESVLEEAMDAFRQDFANAQRQVGERAGGWG